MRHKWTKAELSYLTKPIPKAEVDYDWVWWALIAVISFSGILYMLVR